MPALARLIQKASQSSQVWVITHSTALSQQLTQIDHSQLVYLANVLGETQVRGQAPLDKIAWNWPTR